MTNHLDIQVDGSHYKTCGIQPVEYCHSNDLDFFQGSVIKYVTRWKNKNGLRDLLKARHFLDMYIELEQRKCAQPTTTLTPSPSQSS